MASTKKPDKGDVIYQAQRLAAKGMLDKAIVEWQKLLSQTPNDGNVYNTIGDLHLKANHTADALSAYLKAADVFKAAGFELKSAAIYKKIIKIDPNRLDVYEKLADLHAERGLTGNAVEDYLRVAKQYAQHGDHGAALAVYQKLSRLDPKNCDIRIKLAELCKKLGLDRQAVEAYDVARSLYEERNMPGQAQAILDQILKIDPTFLASKGISGAEASSESAPPGGAADDSLPKNAMSSPPPGASLVAGHPDEGSDAAGDADRLTSPAIVHTPCAAESHPDFEPEPEPPQLSAVDQMENLLAAGDWTSGQALLNAFSDRPIDRFNYLARWVDELLTRQARSDAYCALRSAIELSEEYASFSSDIQSLIIRYLEADPDHLSAYPILAGHLEKAGNHQEAAGIYSKLIEILQERGDDPEAQGYYETLKARFPDTAEFQRWQAVFEPTPTVDLLESTAPSMTTTYSSSDPSNGTRDDLAPVTDGLTVDERAEEAAPPTPSQKRHALSETTLKSYLDEAKVYIKYKLHTKAVEHLEMVVGLAPDSVEARLQLKDLYVKQGNLEKAAVQHLILAQLYDEAGMVDQKEAILVALDALDPEGIYHQKRGTASRWDNPDFETDGVTGSDPMQEAIAAGKSEPTDLVVEEVAVTTSDSKAPSEMTTKVPVHATVDSNPFIDRISASFTESILEHMQDAQNGDSLDQPGGVTDDRSADPVLAEFQEMSLETSMDTRLRGTSEKIKGATALTQQYLKTRYDLGIAYREMGLPQEAIKEFEVAIQAGFRLGEAYAMIARCHRENNAFERAEHLLHEGLKDARCTPDERRQLQHEIEKLSRGVEEDRRQAEADSLSVGEDDLPVCDVEIVAEKETSSDSQPSLPIPSRTRKKRIAYL